MRRWLSDVMKIAAGFWAAGILAVSLAVIWPEYSFPMLQKAAWLLG